MSLDILFDVIGITGAACILLAYFLLQQERMTAHHISYQLLNLLGASLLTVSLFWFWNLGAFIIEICWVMISLYGLARILRSK